MLSADAHLEDGHGLIQTPMENWLSQAGSRSKFTPPLARANESVLKKEVTTHKPHAVLKSDGR